MHRVTAHHGLFVEYSGCSGSMLFSVSSRQHAIFNFIKAACYFQFHQGSMLFSVSSTQHAIFSFIKAACYFQFHQGSMLFSVSSRQHAAAAAIRWHIGAEQRTQGVRRQ
jgi:hypothetical protein